MPNAIDTVDDGQREYNIDNDTLQRLVVNLRQIGDRLNREKRANEHRGLNLRHFYDMVIGWRGNVLAFLSGSSGTAAFVRTGTVAMHLLALLRNPA